MRELNTYCSMSSSCCETAMKLAPGLKHLTSLFLVTTSHQLWVAANSIRLIRLSSTIIPKDGASVKCLNELHLGPLISANYAAEMWWSDFLKWLKLCYSLESRLSQESRRLFTNIVLSPQNGSLETRIVHFAFFGDLCSLKYRLSPKINLPMGSNFGFDKICRKILRSTQYRELRLRN